MKNNIKGYTLIEMVMVLLLMGIMGYMVIIGNRMLDRTILEAKVNQVTKGIEYAKQAAATSGRQYNVFFFKNRVLVRQGMEKPIYTIHLVDDQRIYAKSGDQMILFAGDITTKDACTIKIINDKLGEQAKITVDVATSKVRVYYEKI